MRYCFEKMGIDGFVESYPPPPPSPFVVTCEPCGKNDEVLGLLNGPWAKLRFVEDWRNRRPILDKAQGSLEVSWVHFKRGVEKSFEATAFGPIPSDCSEKERSRWSPSRLLVV